MVDPIRQIYSSKWCPIPHNKCYSGTCVVLITPKLYTRMHISHHHAFRWHFVAAHCRDGRQWQSLYAMTGLCFNSSEISLLCAASPLSLQLYLQKIKTRHAALNWQVKNRGEIYLCIWLGFTSKLAWILSHEEQDGVYEAWNEDNFALWFISNATSIYLLVSQWTLVSPWVTILQRAGCIMQRTMHYALCSWCHN